MTRSRILARLAGFALSMALSCAAFAQAIVVGAKEFTEQLLVAEMTTQLLQANGFAAHKGTGFASTGIRSLQESGIIDLYWEYTGTSLSEFNQIKEKLSPDEGFASVKALDAKRGLAWLAPSKVNNTYALAVRRADALGKGMRSISDLGTKLRAGEGMKLASTAEFLTRADGLRPLQQAYGFEFMSGNVVAMEPGAIYGALRRSDFRRRRGLFHGRAHISHELVHSRGRPRLLSELSARPRRPPADVGTVSRHQADPGEPVGAAGKRDHGGSQCSRRSGGPQDRRCCAHLSSESAAVGAKVG